MTSIVGLHTFVRSCLKDVGIEAGHAREVTVPPVAPVSTKLNARTTGRHGAQPERVAPCDVAVPSEVASAQTELRKRP